MKLREILQETKKKTDVKWIAKLKDGKTKTIWAPTKYDAKQKLGTSILIQGGYTIKKALNEGVTWQKGDPVSFKDEGESNEGVISRMTKNGNTAWIQLDEPDFPGRPNMGTYKIATSKLKPLKGGLKALRYIKNVTL